MRRSLILALLVSLVGAVTACSAGSSERLLVYTSVTQETVNSIVSGFQADHPQTTVEVFRAPTGELAARIAAEQREGGLQADVLWLTDPLSMQQYEAAGLLESWEPTGALTLPEDHRSDSFWGTRILTMVMVSGPGIDPPRTWHDLLDPRLAGRVAFPDPGFAGSSMAVLGYFAATDGYGIEFYEALADNGAVQVNAPGEVVTGVAEGRFDAGITLEFSARQAVADGSPIIIVWPDDGAIALYSPVAVTSDAPEGRWFVEYLLGRDAQERIAASGWQPVDPAIPWEVGGTQVTVDWSTLYDRQQELLDAYRAIFGG